MEIKNQFKAMIITFALILFTLGYNVSAGENDTNMDIMVITDGNVTAYFNASAGGTVNYWIEDVEVRNEFQKIWDAMGDNDIFLLNSINDIDIKVQDAKFTAEQAYLMSNNNYLLIKDNSDTLIDHNDSINELFNRTVLLINELAAFEGDYVNFKNEVNVNFTSLYDLIDELKSNQVLLQDQVDNLQGEISGLKQNLGNIGKYSGLFFLILCGLYLFNRRYPFKDVHFKKNGIVNKSKNGYRDLVKKADKTKKAKAKSNSKVVKRVRRNPEKSPLKLLFSN